MKKVLILLVILAFVLASCAKETKVTVTDSGASAQQPAQTTGQVQQQTTTTTQQSTGAKPDMNALRQQGLDCLDLGERVCRPVNYQIGSIGDTVGFAFGFQNQFNEPKKFTIKLKFVNTQQSVGQSPIEASKDTMTTWLAVNDLDAFYELQPDEKFSKPILVKIGPVVNEEGKSTPTGTYVFEIQAQTYENGFYNDYGGEQEISVKVK
ncbi:hypothetical protein KY308_03650 [Candidatus Woesearchaeota archaeon]|nr:hypothetical protein [Candidatus Woesearchaeota archaeon]